MVDLNKKVFGNIRLSEVIGAEPTLEQFQKALESQFQQLQKDLDSKTKDELQFLLNVQIDAERETNSRPGAMALAQNKIQLLVDYSQKYISEIKKKL